MKGRAIQKMQKIRHVTISVLLLALLGLVVRPTSSLTVAVFGGSGYIGRRVCRVLVDSGRCNSVLSISRTGRPPSYYCDGSWANSVQWLSYDLNKTAEQNLELPPIDAAISLIGNVQPSKEWKQLFGLSFDDDKLRYENGVINERAVELSKQAGADRFAFASVSYETAKTLEGPIAGYMDGKRMAERAACVAFGEDRTVFVGPSLVYGGRRFPALGKAYRSLVESPPARAYIAGNDFLRNLSSAPLEDWLEKMVFSSPVEFDVVARVLCAGGLGLIDRDMVGPRRQGFFDVEGKPVTYPNGLFVDGTFEIERIDGLVVSSLSATSSSSIDALGSDKSNISEGEGKEPPFEGALVGKLPFLYPLPVVFFFATILWSISTEQFVQVSPYM